MFIFLQIYRVFNGIFLLAFNMRKVVLSGREKRPRDLVFLLSCKVTEKAGSGADSFVFSFLVMRRMIQSARNFKTYESLFGAVCVTPFDPS